MALHDAFGSQAVYLTDTATGNYPSGGLTVQGGVASGAVDSGNPIKIGGVASLAPTAGLTAGRRGNVLISTGGALWVATGARATGTDGINNTLGQTSSDGTNTSNYLMVWPHVFNGTTWDRNRKPNSASRIVSAAASTNATLAKASAGDIFHIEATNTTAALKFLKIYNKASAPTVGTDTPVLTIPLQPSNVPTVRTFPKGMYFSTGIAYAITGAAADADTTALVAGDVVGVNIAYI